MFRSVSFTVGVGVLACPSYVYVSLSSVTVMFAPGSSGFSVLGVFAVIAQLICFGSVVVSGHCVFAVSVSVAVAV